MRRQFKKDLLGLWLFQIEDQSALAAIVPIDNLIGDQDRREELVRRVLAAVDLCFPNEAPEEFKDRLAQVDSIEIQRVIAVMTPAITVLMGALVATVIASIMSAILGFNDLAVGP